MSWKNFCGNTSGSIHGRFPSTLWTSEGMFKWAHPRRHAGQGRVYMFLFCYNSTKSKLVDIFDLGFEIFNVPFHLWLRRWKKRTAKKPFKCGNNSLNQAAGFFNLKLRQMAGKIRSLATTTLLSDQLARKLPVSQRDCFGRLRLLISPAVDYDQPVSCRPTLPVFSVTWLKTLLALKVPFPFL